MEYFLPVPVGALPRPRRAGRAGQCQDHHGKGASRPRRPAVEPLRALPKNERDLAIAAANAWVLAFGRCGRCGRYFAMLIRISFSPTAASPIEVLHSRLESCRSRRTGAHGRVAHPGPLARSRCILFDALL